jgi:pyruvate dehydrogenase E2 component (dihydrolipoamide acetyltransferase)
VKGEVTVLEPTAEERAVGRRAAESRATIPTLELCVELVDGGGLTTGRVVSACAVALAEHPRANAAYRDGRFELYSRVNVAVVVSDDGRYLMPTVFDADAKSEAELEDEIERLWRDAVAGRLTASSFTGATFTVWHAARHGLAGAAMPVVPPQAAALAAGRRVLTLSCDHRILYGAQAAMFLETIRSRLEPGG